MTSDQMMETPALSRFVGSDLEPAARLIADAISTQDQKREGLPQLAGMLAVDIDGAQHISAILIVLEAAWLSGYRAGVVDGMIDAAIGGGQA